MGQELGTLGENVKYINGCEEIIELAFHHSTINNKISCLCRDCKNKKKMLEKDVTFHLLTKGWYQDYAHLEWWHLHNEPRQHSHQIEMTVMTRILVMMSTTMVSTITDF